MCWDTTSYGSKDGRSDAPATSPRSSRPHRHTAVLSMDGSERYAFRCRRLQREVHRKIKIIGNKIRDLEAQREFIKSMEQYKEVPDINSDRKGGELTYKESIKMMKEWRKDEE